MNFSNRVIDGKSPNASGWNIKCRLSIFYSQNLLAGGELKNIQKF